MRNTQVQTEPLATTLWTLRKSEKEIVCVFEARAGAFELHISRNGVISVAHRFETEADAAKFAADLEQDLKAHNWTNVGESSKGKVHSEARRTKGNVHKWG
jgi:hypothetical protein